MGKKDETREGHARTDTKRRERREEGERGREMKHARAFAEHRRDICLCGVSLLRAETRAARADIQCVVSAVHTSFEAAARSL